MLFGPIAPLYGLVIKETAKVAVHLTRLLQSKVY
jgi:hypothetical protein